MTCSRTNCTRWPPRPGYLFGFIEISISIKFNFLNKFQIIVQIFIYFKWFFYWALKYIKIPFFNKGSLTKDHAGWGKQTQYSFHNWICLDHEFQFIFDRNPKKYYSISVCSALFITNCWATYKTWDRN